MATRSKRLERLDREEEILNSYGKVFTLQYPDGSYANDGTHDGKTFVRTYTYTEAKEVAVHSALNPKVVLAPQDLTNIWAVQHEPANN